MHWSGAILGFVSRKVFCCALLTFRHLPCWCLRRARKHLSVAFWIILLTDSREDGVGFAVATPLGFFPRDCPAHFSELPFSAYALTYHLLSARLGVITTPPAGTGRSVGTASQPYLYPVADIDRAGCLDCRHSRHVQQDYESHLIRCRLTHPPARGDAGSESLSADPVPPRGCAPVRLVRAPEVG